MSKQHGPGLSIRIDLANGGRFGPGKAALLRAIGEHGSISKAAAALSMSYPRALKLIEEMNGDFATPVLTSSPGGAAGGGSALTQTGKAVLDAYEKACAEAVSAAEPILAAITKREKSR